MPLPTLLLNSTTGLDTNSGAGPSTPITGTNASTSSDGLTITLPNANLASVLTDSSHTILIDSRIRSIVSSGNSGTPTAFVTVSEAVTGSLASQTYAIGGKRRTFLATASVYNNSLAAGWTVYLEEGFSETITIAATLSFTRNGNSTAGHIRLIGFNRSSVNLTVNCAFILALQFSSYWYIEGITFTGIGSGGYTDGVVSLGTSSLGNTSLIVRCRITGNGTWPSSQFVSGVLRLATATAIENIIAPTSGGGGGIVSNGDCHVSKNFITQVGVGIIAHTASTGSPYPGSAMFGAIIEGNTIVNCSTRGIFSREDQFYWMPRIFKNIIHNCGVGIDLGRQQNAATRFWIDYNSISNCTTGISLGSSASLVLLLENNFFNCTVDIVTSTAGNIISKYNLDPQLTIGSSSVTVGNATVLSLLNSFTATSSGGGGGGLILPRPMNGGYSA